MSTNAQPLRIHGEFTIYRAAELAAELKAARAGLAPGVELVVDLAGVDEMDCAGVQLLMAARRSATESGRALRLQGHSAAVREVFRTLQLDTQFDGARAAAN
jgi:anti-anti-sigma factor